MPEEVRLPQPPPPPPPDVRDDKADNIPVIIK
jgi:hypothetical protein